MMLVRSVFRPGSTTGLHLSRNWSSGLLWFESILVLHNITRALRRMSNPSSALEALLGEAMIIDVLMERVGGLPIPAEPPDQSGIIHLSILCHYVLFY